MWNPSAASARWGSQNAGLLELEHEHFGRQQQEQVEGAVMAATAQRMEDWWRSGRGPAEARRRPGRGPSEAWWRLCRSLAEVCRRPSGSLAEAWWRLCSSSTEVRRRFGGGLAETLQQLGRGQAKSHQRLIAAVGVLVAVQVACGTEIGVLRCKWWKNYLHTRWKNVLYTHAPKEYVSSV